MTGRFTVTVAERAALQLEEAREWWSQNRPRAPHAVEHDVAKALELLASHPEVGVKCASDRYPELRRLHLRRIRYHLYYIVAAPSSTVTVVAVWHSSRGSKPPM